MSQGLKCTDPTHIWLKSKNRSYCSTCQNIKYHKNKNNPGFRETRNRYQRKYRYGVTAKPSGLCQICIAHIATVQDHNHATGKARGFLCNRCNIRLAGLEDPIWEAKAKGYLRQYD